MPKKVSDPFNLSLDPFNLSLGTTFLDNIFNWNTALQLALEYIQKYGGGPGLPIGGIAINSSYGTVALVVQLDEHEQIVHRPCCDINKTEISYNDRAVGKILVHPDTKLWQQVLITNGIVAEQELAQKQCERTKAYFRGKLKYKRYEKECVLNGSSTHSFPEVPTFY